MALSFKERFYIMAFIKKRKNADTEEAEAIKELLKNKNFDASDTMTEKRQREIIDRVYKDMIADAEAEKKKFHFKRTREKNAEFEAKLKELQTQNEQKLKGMR